MVQPFADVNKAAILVRLITKLPLRLLHGEVASRILPAGQRSDAMRCTAIVTSGVQINSCKVWNAPQLGSAGP
jgi:hypothetical protein